MEEAAQGPAAAQVSVGGRASRLSPADLLLALAVIVVWSSNFVVGWWGLQRVPPLALATLRFALSAFPAVLLIRRPAVSWASLVAFGAIMGLGQFGFLNLALRSSITPILTSIVVQMQAFFTVLLAALLLRERIGLHSVLALAIAAAGLGLIGVEAGAGATPTGIVLILFAALSWAGCNVIARASGATDMLAYVAWSCVFAVPPLLVLSLMVEGPDAFLDVFRHPSPGVAGVVIWQAAANTLFGYAVWNRLLARYQAASVAPLTLLVPVVTAVLAAVLLGEALQAWKIAACALVLLGLAVNQFGGARAARRVALGPQASARFAAGRRAP